MALIPVSDTLNTTIETATTVIANDTLLRIWQGRDNCVSDLRLNADEARTLAASLLHEAGKQDGQRVSFKWHAADCKPEYQANGLCKCSGIRQAVTV